MAGRSIRPPGTAAGHAPQVSLPIGRRETSDGAAARGAAGFGSAFGSPSGAVSGCQAASGAAPPPGGLLQGSGPADATLQGPVADPVQLGAGPLAWAEDRTGWLKCSGRH